MTTKNKGKANRCNSPGKVNETSKSSSDNRDFHKRPDNSQGKNKNRLRGHNSNHNLDGNDQKRLCRCRRRRFNKLSLSTNKERTKFPDDSNVGSSDLPTNTENASLNSNHNGNKEQNMTNEIENREISKCEETNCRDGGNSKKSPTNGCNEDMSLGGLDSLTKMLPNLPLERLFANKPLVMAICMLVFCGLYLQYMDKSAIGSWDNTVNRTSGLSVVAADNSMITPLTVSQTESDPAMPDYSEFTGPVAEVVTAESSFPEFDMIEPRSLNPLDLPPFADRPTLASQRQLTNSIEAIKPMNFNDELTVIPNSSGLPVKNPAVELLPTRKDFDELWIMVADQFASVEREQQMQFEHMVRLESMVQILAEQLANVPVPTSPTDTNDRNGDGKEIVIPPKPDEKVATAVEFTLLGVSHTNGTALVRSGDELLLVRKGDPLPNNGQVIEIKKSDDSWMLITSTDFVIKQ